MSVATEVLYQVRRRYDIATAKYWEQRRNGGIRELDPDDPDESDALAAGAKFRPTTPAAAVVLGVWQRCKAELDAAAANLAREQGKTDCPVCDRAVPMGEQPAQFEPDPRLPPERDEDAAVFP